MSPKEFFGWMAFYELEPFGCFVEDQRHEAHLQLHYAINSKPGADIPRFLDRDPLTTQEKEAARVAREEKELLAFFDKIEARQKVEEKRAAIKPVKTRKVRKDKGVKRGPRQPKSARGGFGATKKAGPQSPTK